MDRILLKIKRQNSKDTDPYWEEFSLPYIANSNIISCLMDIQKNPINAKGEKVSPVVWESNCLEEVCGTCTMIINGKVRQACSALIDKLVQPIILEPMTKFPCERDLIVNRSRMFESLKKVKAWVPMDGFYDLGPGEKILPDHQQTAYMLSNCMTCGCCVEACPQYAKDNNFLGAAAISQARLFNMHPTGKINKNERLDALMEDGGLASCGNAQNCIEVCPKNIPLTESIALMGRQTTKHMFTRLFG